MKKHFWLIVSILIMAGLVLSACAPAAPQPAAPAAPTKESAPADEATPAEAPAKPTETAKPAEEAAAKVLKVRATKDIANLDTANVVGKEEDAVDRAIMEGLFRYNAAGEIEPQLAETYKVSDDGLTIDFTLRKGVQWQRGYGELTMADVKFSYERFLVTDPKPAYADDWAALDHVEIVDDYTGKLVFKKPQATLWTTVLPMTSGLIVSKKFYDEAGPEKIKTDAVGTGPYYLAEWVPAQKVVLKRFTDYWGAPANYDEIQVIPVEDDKAAEVALQAGELDFSKISLASSDKFQADSSFNVSMIQSTAYNWIGMNVENPKLADINVREAIRYGVDVPSILAAAYNNKAPRANALVPPGSIGYWADAPVYERDVDKAKEYLAKAGLTTLDLTLTYEQTDEYSTWAQIVQENLKDVGINIVLNPLDSSSFWAYGEGGKDKELELFELYYSSVAPEPAWQTMWFTCDQLDMWNWMRWCNAEFDALHREGLETIDTAKRDQIYIDMQKLWDAAVISIFVTNVPQVYVSKQSVKTVIYPGGLSPMLREFAPQ